MPSAYPIIRGRGYVNPMPGLACRSALRNIGTYREIKVVFPLHSWGIPCGITDHALVSGEDAQHMIDIPFGSWQAGCEIVVGIIALATMPRKEHRTPREPAAVICDLALSAWYYIDDIPECESIRTVNRLGKGRSAREQSEWSEAMQGVCMSSSPHWAHLLLD